MIKTYSSYDGSLQEVKSVCIRCEKWVIGKEGYPAFGIYDGNNYLFKCECGYEWEEED